MDDLSKTPLFRPSWAIIDLGALEQNYLQIKKKLSDGLKIMAVVKADAYGHGAVPVSKMLEKLGVRALGVATVEEGIELRSAGIKTDILVMGGLMGVGLQASKKVIEAGLTPVIHSIDVLNMLDADVCATREKAAAGIATGTAGKKVGVHLKIDTGMGRLGIRPELLPKVLERIKKCPHLFIEGVMTHLAEGNDAEPSMKQMEIFMSCKSMIENELGKIPIWHIANSAAFLAGKPVEIPEAKESWVRPGIAIYGSLYSAGTKDMDLKPVMGLTSRAVLIKHVPEGTKISYGGTFVTKRPSRIAIVPIGYADGYPWSVSGKASVLIGGRRVKVLGRVTMDMIVIDITDVPDAAINDEVVLLGRQGGEMISADEISTWAGTIPYEILCGISKRMPRVYTEI